MSEDKREMLAAFCFETITATISQTKTYSRVGPHIDRVAEAWGQSPGDFADMLETASSVREMLYDAHQMVDMDIEERGPSVEMLLERDVLSALNAQLAGVLVAKGVAVVDALPPGDSVEQLKDMIVELSASRHVASIEAVANKDYYVPVIKNLARKLGVPLTEEEAL